MDKILVKKRRKEISDIINAVGLNGLDRSAIASKYHVSLMQISKDVKVILKNVSEAKIGEITDQLGTLFNEAFLVSRRALKSEDENIRLKAVNCLTGVIGEFTGFLKSAGYNIVNNVDKKISFEQLRDLLKSDPMLEKQVKDEIGINIRFVNGPTESVGNGLIPEVKNDPIMKPEPKKNVDETEGDEWEDVTESIN